MALFVPRAPDGSATTSAARSWYTSRGTGDALRRPRSRSDPSCLFVPGRPRRVAQRARRGPDRRLRALLVVHGRDRVGPLADGRAAEDRGRLEAAREVVRSAPRTRTRSRRSTSTRSSSRPREGAPLHGRRRAREPGPAAAAYVLEADDGTVLAAHGEAIGVATNNVAEYRASSPGSSGRATSASTSSRSSPTPSSSSSRCAASTR